MAADAPRGPLAGHRVVDLTEHMAGPYCTMILADMGAEVLKVERQGRGDAVREWGDSGERNPYFLYINRNKESLTLNYKTEAGREIFHKLVAEADILVENYRASVMERAGFGYEALSQINPRLIYASLSGFGPDGPYREKGGFDLIAQAMGGVMHVTGEPDGPPTSVGQPICDLGTGMWGAMGILAAVLERQRTGRGQRVTASLLETAVAFSSWTGAGFLADGREPTRQGSRHRQGAPYQRFDTADGYIMVGADSATLWPRFCQALGHPEWVDDPRFVENAARVANRKALEDVIEAVLTTRPTEHWVRVLDEAGVPCGPVNTYTQLFSDPQVRHLGCVEDCEDAELGRVPHLRTPLRLSAAGVGVRHTAPALGEHNEAVLTRLGYSPEQVATLREQAVI